MGFFDRFISKPPSKDKFAKMVLDGVRRAGETGKIGYDAKEFSLRGEESCISYLGNAYQEYCAVPKAHRDEVLKKWVRVWFVRQKVMPEDFEDACHDILPTVRSRSFYELLRLRTTVEEEKTLGLPYAVLGEYYAMAPVYDYQESLRSIGETDLDNWGVSLYEVLEVARENLLQLPHPFMGPADGEGTYLAAAKDSYDSSRLLTCEAIRHFRLKGDPIAMIPNRETLVVTGADDVDGLRGMLKLVEDAVKQPRYILAVALRLDGDEWVPWLPDVDHPLYWDFRTWRTRSMGQDYTEQKELLDKLHQKTGEDVFVASFSGLEDSGHFASYSVWTKGVPTLLPRTDRIALLDPADDNPVLAEWDCVAGVVGDMMEAIDVYPPRFRVVGFPDEMQLAAIRGKA